MADYTTVADVQAYYLGVKFTSTADYLTDTNVGTFITEQSAIIDLKIQKKYTLPITATNDKAYLKVLCEKMVVCKIDKILRQNANPEELEFMRKRGYCKQAQKMLNDILNGEIELGATQKSFRPINYNKTTVSTDDEESCR